MTETRYFAIVFTMKKYALLLVFIFALSSILLPDAGKKEKKNDWEYQLQKYSRIYSSIKKYYPEKIDREKLFLLPSTAFLKSWILILISWTLSRFVP